MNKKIERVSPFSSGVEFSHWQESNCARCAKSPDTPPAGGEPLPCEIDQALLVAYWDDGTISADIAARMGIVNSWQCQEFQDRG